MRFVARVLASLTLLLPACPAAFAAPNPADYPLRIVVMKDHASNHYYDGMYFYSHGRGKANLFDGARVNAMEYQFRCEGHPTSNEADEFYPARWKKPGVELEMLMGEIGSSHVSKCTLQVAMKPYVYRVHDGSIETLTQEQWANRQQRAAEASAAMTPADTDYAHYTVKVSLLHLELGERSAYLYSGSAQGNVYDANGVPHAADMSVRCPVRVHENPDGRFYRGKWSVPDQELTILLHNYDDPSKFATCTLRAHTTNEVYVRTAAGIQAVSLEKFHSLPQAAANVPETPGNE
ncbi:hypothetical protein ACFQBQ_17100 [Granulicella cerasi]|uniref:Uncharacterized protein n=1 Tax=Granulicella cerasi TaxID=741063 RepID=A0ABW1ZDM3_9BACT|nr:hypothetical protein [Granulicella cerasi]